MREIDKYEKRRRGKKLNDGREKEKDIGIEKKERKIRNEKREEWRKIG